MNKHNKMPKWGFLRETRELAVKAGIDKVQVSIGLGLMSI